MNLIPCRIVIDGVKGWKWLGKIIYPASVHDLKWEYTGFGCYRATVPFGNGANYEIGPSGYLSSHDNSLMVAVGNGMPSVHRRTIQEAMNTCLIHYTMNKRIN